VNKAPIILFVYNRPWHTKQTVEALQKNELAKDSELFIYSDAPRDASAEQAVQEVREYIRNIDGFKNITIVERDENWGLAKSIIDGVTKIVNEYGKVIVLEDDHVTSKYFLNYMNDALEFYKDTKEVWHISGWNYPLGGIFSSKKTFLWRVMNCWGWATWADRWQHFEYFSLVTLPTLGYGDILPQTPRAAALCQAEAVMGQFYMAVLVARLVGIQVSQEFSSSREDKE
jgi:hypothetical protein